jgi:hypothetical protein
MLFDPIGKKELYRLYFNKINLISDGVSELIFTLNIEDLDYIDKRMTFNIKRSMWFKLDNMYRIDGTYIKNYTIEENHISVILSYDSFHKIHEKDDIFVIIRQAKLNKLLENVI